MYLFTAQTNSAGFFVRGRVKRQAGDVVEAAEMMPVLQGY